LFGTLPSSRRAPVIPLLPTTISSAPWSLASSIRASAGSPLRACVSTSTPSAFAIWAAALRPVRADDDGLHGSDLMLAPGVGAISTTRAYL
jgi:hypothetical protein